MRQTPRLVAANPVPGAKDRPKAVRKEKYIPTEDEVSRFFAEVRGDPLEPLYVLIAATGLRLGEALALHWKHFDRFRRTVHVKKNLAEHSGRDPYLKDTKTKESERPLPSLNDEVIAALERHRLAAADRGHDGPEFPVFADPAGCFLKKSHVYRHSFDKAIERAGIKRFTLHALRHRVAVVLLKAGVSVVVVSKMLGHATPKLTLDLYGNHVRDDDHAGVSDMLKVPALKAAGAG
jgi:integrase